MVTVNVTILSHPVLELNVSIYVPAVFIVIEPNTILSPLHILSAILILDSGKIVNVKVVILSHVLVAVVSEYVPATL